MEPECAAVSVWETDGGILVYLLVLAYCFYLFETLIDSYFVPALAVLSERLKLSDDVAGATFMAAGASCPELFMGLIGAFSSSDVGVGVAVGACLFNMTCIVGAVALVSPVLITLNWRTLIREVFFFGFASLLLLASLGSERIQWWESLSLVLFYVFYVVVCAYYPSIQDRFCSVPTNQKQLLSDVDSSSSDALSSDLGLPVALAPEHLAPPLVTQTSPLKQTTNKTKVYTPEKKKKEESKPLEVSYQADSTPADKEEEEAVDPKKVAFSGFLFKKNRFYTRVGASVSTVYQKFWFTLSDHLYYYPDPRFPDSNRSYINLYGVTSVERSDSDPLMILIHGWGNLMTWRLRAWTEDIAAEWHMHLQLRLRDISRERKRGLLPGEAVIEEAIKKSDSDDEEAKSLFSLPQNATWWRRVLWLAMLPCFLAFTLTIPDVRTSRWRHCWLFSILITVAWLALISWLVVLVCDRLGCVAGISSDVIGITIAAVGAALPNMFASIVVAKQGLGNMAIANAFGSNVFNICIALGFPWFLKTCIVAPGQPYYLEAESLNVLVLLLVVVLMAAVAVAVALRMRLGYILGRTLIFGYCVVLVTFLLVTH
eukprot:gb/GEZN01002791.1/.p1 GENE.gb/GEZN01002791.1/~~gb/GEZN01002791.1/.p1  ORF type:complete len:598 (-),score=111.83 gb/GEZN01002791.1/:502-2295(-)